jgi:hypothetical protein
VALAPVAGRGFISDGGGDGAIVIFDIKTHAVLGSLAAMPDADGIIFDPTSGHVLVVSGRGKALMSFKPDIDPKNGKIDERSRCVESQSSSRPIQPAGSTSISWTRTKWRSSISR